MITFQALGDRALLACFADELSAITFTAAVDEARFPWLVDLVPAYTSVGIHFDPEQIRLQGVRAALQALPLTATEQRTGRLHLIPCCYERQLDLARVAEFTHQSPEAIIALHIASEYTVYAIGFCPGFPYLGYLPPELCGVPRLPNPRLRLEAGSVGLTGKQTGLYPLIRPGGWNIIGQTPLELVNPADDYFPLAVGDRVRFQRIDEREFEHLQGERLPR